MKYYTTILVFAIYSWISFQPVSLCAQSYSIDLQPNNKTLSTKSTHHDDHSAETLDIQSLLHHLRFAVSPSVLLKSKERQEEVYMYRNPIVNANTQLVQLTQSGVSAVEFPYQKINAYVGKSATSDFSFLKFGNEKPYGGLRAQETFLDITFPQQTTKSLQYSNLSQKKTHDNTSLGGCSNHEHSNPISQSKIRSLKSSVTKIMRLTMVLDYQYVLNAGSKEAAINKSLGVINSIHPNFTDEFVHDLRFEVGDLIISDCASCDPWSSTTEANQLLLEVNEWVHDQVYLNENDAIVFWTGRDLQGDVIGSSHTASLCTPINTLVLQDISDSAWKLRVLAAHELGHTLSSSHDAQTSTIMAPKINNSIQWSSSSKNAINTFLQSNSCLVTESDTCPDLTSVTAKIVDDQLEINWEGDPTLEYQVTVAHSSNQSVLFDTYLTGNSVVVDGAQSCVEYFIVVAPVCAVIGQNVTQLIYSDYKDVNIQITEATPSNCYVSEDQTKYDLEISVSNSNQYSVDALIEVGEKNALFLLLPGIHIYKITGLRAITDQEHIVIRFDEEQHRFCAATYAYQSPSADCAFLSSIDFDNCTLPEGWQIGVIQSNVHAAYQWTIKGSSRNLLNYGNSLNATTSKTIDGTCMAILDDDAINNTSHSGTTWLQSKVMNLSSYDTISFSFDYIFDDFKAKGDNNSYLKVEVWSGSIWTEVWSIEDGACQWYEAWRGKCVGQVALDITQYKSDNLKIRWLYSDGDTGSWAGMAAIDNIRISAVTALGAPCAIEEYRVVGDLGVGGNPPYARSVYVETEVSDPVMSITASETVIFEPGAAIMQGTSISVEIAPCDQ